MQRTYEAPNDSSQQHRRRQMQAQTTHPPPSILSQPSQVHASQPTRMPQTQTTYPHPPPPPSLPCPPPTMPRSPATPEPVSPSSEQRLRRRHRTLAHERTKSERRHRRRARDHERTDTKSERRRRRRTRDSPPSPLPPSVDIQVHTENPPQPLTIQTIHPVYPAMLGGPAHLRSTKLQYKEGVGYAVVCSWVRVDGRGFPILRPRLEF
ncbi:hypothetical protein M011DRAFT_526198 [Sporormia fimetaria CBS 119925]|uniref:Uncharacterized protein n=1 Tax=Sporormia fimetaria CBS 119925 TaxID=1340428 RepID=A0A6A6VD27_9PLEO|nr:hypothetical protein M011DRAFT_526198 [Sporormia fimetaria CBS 119925]